jgi:hypothetical protein
MTTALKGGEGSVSRPGYFSSGKDPVPTVEEAGWAPGPVWTGAENLVPIGIWYPDRPARSQLLYQLSYPAHVYVGLLNKIKTMSSYCPIVHKCIASPTISYDSVNCRLWLGHKTLPIIWSPLSRASYILSINDWIAFSIHFSFLKPFWASVNIPILLDKKFYQPIKHQPFQ